MHVRSTSATIGRARRRVTAVALLVGSLAGALTLTSPFVASAQSGAPLATITTVAGSTGDGVPAIGVVLDADNVAADAAGNVYVGGSGLVRKIAAGTGIVSTIAGIGGYESDGDGGPATNADVQPSGLAIGPNGDVYIADDQHDVVRKVSAANGIITTVAGTGDFGSAGDGGPAVAAQLDSPAGVVVSSTGVLYIAERGGNRIRKVVNGIITRIAGTGIAGFGFNNQPALTAQLSSPTSLALDANEDLYIADRGNQRVRKLTFSTGNLTTIAGNGTAGFDGDGPGPSRALNFPTAIGISGGLLSIADKENHRVRQVSLNTLFMTTVAGTGTYGSTGDGGPALAATLAYPSGLAIAQGRIHIVDGFSTIRMISGSNISTFAGLREPFAGDGGPATSAVLSRGQTVDSAPNGDLYIADLGSYRIRKVDAATGVITTVAGTGDPGFVADGPALSSNISPGSIALGPNGDVYFSEFADFDGGHIRKLVVATGMIVTVAGTSTSDFNGDGPIATTNLTSGSIDVDAAGSVYLADSQHHRVRKIDVETGMVSTLAGTGVYEFNGDGPASTTNIDPESVAVDSSGNLYVTDSSNLRIRKVTVETGMVSTVAGTGVYEFNGDGPAATTNVPAYRLTVGPDDDVYFAEADNPRVRRLSVASGTITTLAGTGRNGRSPDGGPGTSADLGFVAGLTVDRAGRVMFSDGFGRIRSVSVELANHVGTQSSSEYHPVSPERFLDTRDGTGAPVGVLAAGATLRLHVTGVGVTAIPADAAAVALNVAVTESAAAGYLTVWPCGQPRPLAANLNWVAGQTIPNLVIAKIGEGGDVCIYTLATTHVVADVNGWFAPGPGYHPVSPERFLDTRDGTGAPVGVLAAGATLRLHVTGVGVTAIPADAAAVALNVAVTESAAAGYLTVWPCGQPRPLAANLNWVAGETIPNLVIAKIGEGGDVCIYTLATTHVVADVNGWFAPGPGYHPVSPERFLDTRDGTGAPVGVLPAGETLVLHVTGVGATNVPTSASAVAINVAVTEPGAPGFLTIWPCGQPRPLAANLNWVPGQTIPNLVIAKVGDGGNVCIYTLATTHVVADINGWI